MNIGLPKCRWFHLTPDRFVIGLVIVECLLWLSQRFRWFSFNQHKGWTVLIALTVVGAWLLLTLLWLIVSQIVCARFQFSLRSLFVLVLASAIPCSWLAEEMRLARRQREVVRAIKTTPISYVVYDWQCDCDGQLVGELPLPAWLEKLLGVDFFSDIDSVQPGFGGFGWEVKSKFRTTEERLAQLEEQVRLRDERRSRKNPAPWFSDLQ